MTELEKWPTKQRRAACALLSKEHRLCGNLSHLVRRGRRTNPPLASFYGTASGGLSDGATMTVGTTALIAIMTTGPKSLGLHIGIRGQSHRQHRSRH